MKQSPGFVAQESVHICYLRKSLYGLKQFSRAWFRRFALVVQEFKLCRFQKDDVFFWLHQGKQILLLVFLDDIDISELKLYMQKKFQTEDLGQL